MLFQKMRIFNFLHFIFFSKGFFFDIKKTICDTITVLFLGCFFLEKIENH